jgi:hypothetical protein
VNALQATGEIMNFLDVCFRLSMREHMIDRFDSSSRPGRDVVSPSKEELKIPFSA